MNSVDFEYRAGWATFMIYGDMSSFLKIEIIIKRNDGTVVLLPVCQYNRIEYIKQK